MSLQELQANASWDQIARTVINTAIRKLGALPAAIAAEIAAEIAAAITALKAATNSWSGSNTFTGAVILDGATSKATDAEYIAKTATDKAVVPSNLAALPTFFAHNNSSAQTGITSATPVKVTINTEVWDIGGYFASSAWTPPVGKYRVSASVVLTSANAVDNEQIVLSIYVGGSLFRSTVNNRAGTGNVGTFISIVTNLSGSQAVEVYITKGGAGDGTVAGAGTQVWFCGEAIA